MINWKRTRSELSITEDIVVNSDKVYVICEKCGYERLQFYNVAGRRDKHTCMSCAKTKSINTEHINLEKTRELGTKKIITDSFVIAKCSKCQKEVKVRYNHKRFENFMCGSCKLKQKWKNGDYKPIGIKFTGEQRKKISIIASEKWKDPEYRKRWLKSRAKTREKRSSFSKKMWSDKDKKHNLSIKIKESFNKNPRKGEKVRQDNIKRWADPEFRKRISSKCKGLWDTKEYRERMEEIRSTPQYKEKRRQMFEDPEYRKKLSENGKKVWSKPGYKEKMAQVRINQPKTSFQQEILYSILDDLKIKYYKDSDKECMIGYYTFDCRIDPQEGIKPQNSLLVEVNGDYWHNLEKSVRKDKAKATYLKEYFPQYDLKYLWEHEFHNKDRIISLIKYWLGIDNPDLIDFDLKTISYKIIDFKEAELFISKYHYAGRVGRSGVNLGFYIRDELIAVIVYSQPVRQETATKQGYKFKEVLELSRLAIHPSYQKKNLASHIIARSIKTVKELRPEIKLLVSFADSTHNHSGTIYKASNWKLDGIVSPDYWYSDDEGYVCHKKTLWNHAKSLKMTEKEYCEKYGYQKIWGKEKNRFTYKL